MSPRERPMYVAADPSEGGVGRTVAAFALFAVVALPVGLLISSIKSQQQLREEKAAFRRLGLDWEKRFQYPK